MRSGLWARSSEIALTLAYESFDGVGQRVGMEIFRFRSKINT
jgi:hypothetical protein